MKALHRTIAGSAFALLAAGTIAASAAYACHPKASVAFSNYNPMPGDYVRVQGNGFDANTMVKIWFGSKIDSLIELDSTVAQAVDPTGRPQVDVVVRVPPGATWGTYLLAATQEGGANPGYFRDTVTVGPKSSGSPGGASSSNVDGPKDPPPSVPPPVAAGDVSAGGSGAGAPIVTVAPAPAALRSEPATPPGAASSPDQPVAEAAVVQDRLDKVGSDGPTQAPLPFESAGAPPAGDLWSGVDPAQVPALLDAPTPPPQQGGAAVGVVLLGFGAATLGGIGLAVGRRRLALATRR